MNVLRAVKTDLIKTLLSPYFPICIGIILALMLASNAYYDQLSSKSYTVIESIFRLSFEEKEALGMYDLTVLGKYGGEWFSSFMPIAVTFAFIPVFSDERKSGNIRFSICRESRFSFCLSKLSSAFISAGLAAALAFLLYAAIVFMLFPASQDVELAAVYMPYGVTVKLALTAAKLFLFGGISSMPVLALFSFIKNKYIVMCLPFMLRYITAQAYSSFSIELLSSGNEVPALLCAAADRELLLTDFWNTDKLPFIVIFYLLYIGVCAAVFSAVTIRRTDCGE